MVCQLRCDCNEREGVEIISLKQFRSLEEFFNKQVKSNIFTELEVEQPFYAWNHDGEHMEWFATKWYKCRVCGCLWEVDYPDFPAKGFVRKFSDGIYKARGF